MTKLLPTLAFTLLLALLGAGEVRSQQEAKQPAQTALPTPPPARKIPGINAEDKAPGGCVDCHKNNPQAKMDARFSVWINDWQTKVPPELLAKTKDAAPKGMEIKGRHPKVDADLTTAHIPEVCLDCHAKEPKNKKEAGPPFARLAHRIHMVGGEDNHFMTYYQGECTNCHKLDQKTGAWSLGSGTEIEAAKKKAVH